MTDENKIEWEDFEKVEIRVGMVINVEDFPEARNPALALSPDDSPNEAGNPFSQ